MNQTVTTDLSAVITAVESAGLFSSLCTIQEPDGTPDALGQSDAVDWTDVDDLEEIPCMASPIGHMRAGGERDAPTFTMENDALRVILDGVYPNILLRHRAVIDGVPWNIDGVGTDSQRTYTWMVVKRFDV